MTMTNQLNNSNYEHLNGLYDYYLQELNSAEIRNKSGKNIDINLYVIQDTAADLGLISYALGKNKKEIREYFKKSALATVELFDDPTNSHATPLVMLEGIRLALISGLTREAQLLVSKITFSWGLYDDGEFVADQVISGYIISLSAYLLGKKKEALDAAIKNIKQNEDRTEDFVNEYLLCCRALVSLIDGDNAAFEKFLLEILNTHEHKYNSGIFEDDPEGFICVDGLSLAAIGRESGFEIKMENVFLPLWLLPEKQILQKK